MGTDNLFHKRRERRTKDIRRRQSVRAPYDKVLIVCEGERTEPNYFNDLRQHHKLNTANIEICGEECGSDPLSIFNFAKQRYREMKDAGDPYDRVYCLFDRDQHSNYQEAIDKINRATPHGVYHATPSVPCFEYWILLHFDATEKPFNNCTQLLKQLGNYLPGYTKGMDSLYTDLLGQLEFATHNAKRALANAKRAGTDNPSTHIHELVTYLRMLQGN